MGFYNRFRKKNEKAGAEAPVPAKGEMVSEQPSSAGGKAPGADETTEVMAAPQIKEVSVEELKARMDAGTAPLLIDVREPWEHQIVNIESAKLIPMNTIPEHMEELDKNAEIIVHCHHGQRSWNVAAYMMQHGFTNVKNLTGGIDSWARRVDKTKRTY